MRRPAALLALLMLLSAPASKAEGPAGIVRLSRAEYDRLKDDAEAPAAPARRKVREVPPSIEGARYDLRVEGTGASMELSADVVVKGPVVDARFALPLAGRLESFADRGPAAVLVSATDAKSATLRFTSPGRYHVVARVLLPERETPGGVRTYDFTTVAAPSARLAAIGAPAGTTVEWSADGGGAEALPLGAVRPVPTSSVVHVKVKMSGGLPAAPAEKPVVIAETVDAARPQRERLLVRTVAKLNVSRADLAELALQFSPGSRLLSVSGPDEPTLTIADNGGAVLRFGKPLRGEAVFSVLTWRPMPDTSGNVELHPTGVAAVSALRSFLLVTPAAIRRYEPVSNEGLQRTDASDLPELARPFVGGSTRAYRAVETARALLVFSSPLRDVSPAADTLVDETSLLTVFGDGGVRTDQRRFTIQTRRPFFEVPIGDGEEILSVSVDDIAVKSQGQRDRLVVVLPPSSAKRRVVQVVTKRSGADLPKKGELRVEAGPLAGASSVGTWTVVLPDDRRYRFVESEGLKKAGWLASPTATEPVAQAQPANWLGSDTTAIVSGRVADTSGAPLPGVTVQVRGGGFSRTVVSDAQGNFRIPGVPAGRYSVSAALSGFSSVSQSVETRPGGGYFLPIPMKVSVSESVVVTGEAPVVDTTKSSMGISVSPDQFRASPRPSQNKAVTSRTVEGGVEGGVSGGVMGGVLGGAKGAASYDNAYVVDGVNQSSERSNAGVRSLPVEVTARGKRLVLSGPLAGAGPLWVRVAMK